jgi:hypothetical protein
MQELKDMTTDQLKFYATHHRVTVGRGNWNQQGLRNAIARDHLKADQFEEPDNVAPTDFRCHKFFNVFAKGYRGLSKFKPKTVFGTISTDESGVTSMRDGNSRLVGGNLRNSVVEMPPAELTSSRGRDLQPCYVFFLTLVAAYDGACEWKRVAVSNGRRDPGVPRRLRLVMTRDMRCSMLGTRVDMKPEGKTTPFTATLNNVSNKAKHSKPRNHVPKHTEILNQFLNWAEHYIFCLKHTWQMTIVGTLDALRRKTSDRDKYEARVAQHTKTLLSNAGWLDGVLHHNNSVYHGDVRNNPERIGNGEQLRDRDVFIKWFENNGAVCEVSEMLINDAAGAFKLHLDRILDDRDHTTRNCRAVCLIFMHQKNPSREQWLQLLLDQDLVHLADDDRTRVTAELKRLAANEMMTRKHAVRTNRSALAASADDSRFSRR